MSESPRCPECGAELPPGSAGQGPCPACLLKLGLSGAIPRVDVEDGPAPAPTPVAAPSRPVTRPRAPVDVASWVIGGAIVAAALAAAWWVIAFFRPSDAPAGPEMRLTIAAPGFVSDPVSLAVSPDGSQLVFVADHEGRQRLWVRRMSDLSPRPLPGTEDAAYPFWSPDGQHVGFFTGTELRRIAVAGGPSQRVAPVPRPCGGTWLPDGQIVLGDCDGPLMRVPASGGDVSRLTTLEGERETGHRFPYTLPGGDRLLYFADGADAVRGVYALDLGRNERQRVAASDTAAVYSSGHLFFVRQGTLLAQRSEGRADESAQTVVVAEGVAWDPARRAAAVSASSGDTGAGVIVFRPGTGGNLRQLAMVDREGRLMSVAETESNGAPAVSPDGARIAFSREVGGNVDLWVHDLARELTSRLTFDEGPDTRPIWSPDGRDIVFHSTRRGAAGVYRKRSDGSSGDTLLFPRQRRETVTGWSADGRLLVYHHRGQRGSWDISVTPADAVKPAPVLQSDFDEMAAQFSPDGRWLAYQANESGRFEIYVRSLQGDVRAQVSAEGGAHVRWSREGRELYFVAPNGSLMAVDISLAGDAVRTGRPYELRMQLRARAEEAAPYDVSRGAFVAALAPERADQSITVIVNWRPPQS